MREPEPQIRIFANLEELAEAAGDEFFQRAKKKAAKNSSFTVALSGGSTPGVLYRYLAKKAESLSREDSLWENVHFFWGDERSVPADHPDSNFGLANNTLLSKLPISPEQIHRIKIDIGDGEKAAENYERELCEFFHLSKGEFPCFDLIFLGMGTDGHTASLFPGTKALGETSRLVIAPWVDKLKTYRVTLTFPVFNHARCVIFLIAGKEKAKTLKNVLGPSQKEGFPAKLIQPDKGELFWFVDKSAAHLL